MEKGHPAVDQWNYGLDNADFTLTVENESVAHHAGDWSFVPAGLDHSLTGGAGQGSGVHLVRALRERAGGLNFCSGRKKQKRRDALRCAPLIPSGCFRQ